MYLNCFIGWAPSFLETCIPGLMDMLAVGLDSCYKFCFCFQLVIPGDIDQEVEPPFHARDRRRIDPKGYLGRSDILKSEFCIMSSLLYLDSMPVCNLLKADVASWMRKCLCGFCI